jgi:hypothetical protein
MSRQLSIAVVRMAMNGWDLKAGNCSYNCDEHSFSPGKPLVSA